MNKHIPFIERVKDVLIVLLTLSALWLVTQGHWTNGPEPVPGAGETQTTLPGQSGTAGGAEVVHPLRITANLVGTGREGRCTVQYDEAAVDELFQQTAGLLVEALSSAGEPKPVSRRLWEDALTRLPGLSFDFQGSVPLDVLLGWLTGEQTMLDAAVTRLTLAVEEDMVSLYYREADSGDCFRAGTQAVNRAHLEEALAALSDNGAYYAFETDWADNMDPDTLFRPELPPLPVYSAKNPVAGGWEPLYAVMGDLGFSVNNSSLYTSGDELVARSGNDMLRLSEQGALRYEKDGEGPERFPVTDLMSGDGLLDAVESCREVASAALNPRADRARLYLTSAREEDGWTEVIFDYALNGMPVALNRGHAARFLVREGRIVRFDLQFRSYSLTEATAPVLPPRQASAALEPLELEGEELTLVYSDTGGDSVRPGWGAVNRRGEK